MDRSLLSSEDAQSLVIPMVNSGIKTNLSQETNYKDEVAQSDGWGRLANKGRQHKREPSLENEH